MKMMRLVLAVMLLLGLVTTTSIYADEKYYYDLTVDGFDGVSIKTYPFFLIWFINADEFNWDFYGSNSQNPFLVLDNNDDLLNWVEHSSKIYKTTWVDSIPENYPVVKTLTFSIAINYKYVLCIHKDNPIFILSEDEKCFRCRKPERIRLN
jgi:hypothetical protein